MHLKTTYTRRMYATLGKFHIQVMLGLRLSTTWIWNLLLDFGFTIIRRRSWSYPDG